MSKFCLCAIVRNESARIERMLDSVKGVISCFVILDTGSTDDTAEKIKEWGNIHHIPGIVAYGAFVNFSQARNQALDAARSWREHETTPKFDYFLLCDADMELRVESTKAFEDLTGEAYEMAQKAGSYSYNNLRLLHAESQARYIGVTHEYLSANSFGAIVGAYFVDHADGANRGEKYERDIRLFEQDLKVDPDNGRTWFYLGNTYRDAGRFVDAERCYRRKLSLPTWPEENWLTQVNLANCLERQGREAEYISAALDAYQMRPTRAEPLHALAKHYRLKGQYMLATMFADKGLSIGRPDDRLFIEDWVYEWGLREEYSIAGFYDLDTRERAFRITDGLATDPKVPEYLRRNARANMVFYLRPLRDFCQSYSDRPIAITPSPGFTAMNPCVTNRPGGLEVLVRTVNYKIDEHGRYMIGPKECREAPIETENWLVQLRHDLSARQAIKVEWERPPAAFPLVLGLEDMRIFWHQGERQFVACARETSLDGLPRQVHGFLSRDAVAATARVSEWATISDPMCCEKNWAPVLGHTSKGLPYMYRLDKIQRGALQQKVPCQFAVDNISGGSQYIPFEGGYLAVVHEAVAHPAHGRRIYQHRFVWLDENLTNHRLSVPFVFHDVQIEFAAGLARGQNDDLVVSFGECDSGAWLATVKASEVAAMLGFKI